MSNSIHFDVSEVVSLADRPLRVKIKGLLPHQNVTVRLKRPTTNPNVILESYGQFDADQGGVVDLDTQPPSCGTYSQVDGMGLFWSMQFTEVSNRNDWIYVPLSPITFTLTAHDEERLLATTTFKRLWMEPTVKRVPVREDGLVATYLHHEDDHPRPGIIVFHGIEAKSSDKLPAAWTFRGEIVPYASEVNPYRLGKIKPPTSKFVSYRPWYEEHLSDENVVSRATIPVERINGSVLFISGAQDQMLHSVRVSSLSMERLRAAHHPYKFEHLVYPEAGHAIRLPYRLSAWGITKPQFMTRLNWKNSLESGKEQFIHRLVTVLKRFKEMINIVFQTLTGQLSIVITLAFGAILIALYPLLHKESRSFAWFSLLMGIIVWLLLFWFTFGNPVIRYQILQYGLH